MNRGHQSQRHTLTRTLRNTRAVELWLQNRSWRSISHHLQAEGYGSVSHQYVSRVVKRELQRAWEDAHLGAPVMPSGGATAAMEAPEAIATRGNGDDAEPALHSPPVEMFVESFFSARHFVVTNEVAGTPHHHSYRVSISITGTPDLRTGYVIGFAEAQRLLDDATVGFHERFLNTLPEFELEQPTTERLAAVIFARLKAAAAMRQFAISKLTLWESPTKGVVITGPQADTHGRDSRANEATQLFDDGGVRP